MKTKIKLMALVAGLLSILPMQSAWAGGDSTTYYAALKAAVSSSGGGMVYAGTSNKAGTYAASSTSDSQTSTTQDEGKTFYAFAQADEGFEFAGWATSDGGTVASTDNPYSVEVKCSSSDSSKPTTTTVLANFKKKLLAAFGITFETSDAGTYTVDGAAPANKTGLTEATTVSLASTDPNFLNWKVNGTVVNDNPYTATCLADTTISAEFLTADQVAEATTFDDLTAALANDGKKKVIVPSGTELIVEKGATLTVPTGKQLVVEGTLAVIGTVNNSGVIFGNGKFMKISKIISQEEIQTLYMANGEECPKITEAHHSGIWPKYRKTTVEANTPSVTGAAVGCATTGWGVYFNGKVTSISKQSPVAVKVNVNTGNAVNDITAVVENGDVDSINAQGAYVLFDNCSIKGPPRGTSGDDAKRLNFNGTVDCAGKKVTFGLARTYSDFAPIILNGTIDFQPTTDFQNAAVLAFNCSSVTVKNIKGTGGKQYFYDCGTPSSTCTITLQYQSSSSRTAYFYNGYYKYTFGSSDTGKCNVYGGSYTSDPTSYIPSPLNDELYAPKQGNFFVVQPKPVAEYVVSVDDAQYESLEEALGKAPAGSTITLIAGVDLTDKTINVASGKQVTIDLNKHQIVGGKIVNNGTLVITDYATANESVVEADIENHGTLDVIFGTYKGDIVNKAGTLTIYNGAFDGSIASDGGTLALKGGHFTQNVTDMVTADNTKVFVSGKKYYVCELPNGTFYSKTVSNVLGYGVTPYNDADYEILKNYVSGKGLRTDYGEADWVRLAELLPFYEVYNNMRLDPTLVFDRAVAAKSLKFNVQASSTMTLSLDSDVAAGEKYRTLSEVLAQFDSSSKTYKALWDDGIKEVAVSFSNVSTANAGTLCKVMIELWETVRAPDYSSTRHMLSNTVYEVSQKQFVIDAGDNTAMIRPEVGAATFYPTLKEACEAAKNGETVMLCNDCTTCDPIAVPCSFVLDTNGFAFTGAITAGDGYALTATDLGDGKTQYEVAREAVAKIGETAFASLAEAIEAAAESGETIDVVKESTLTVAEGIELTVTSGQLVAAVPAGNVLELKDGTDVALTWPTVAGAADHIIVTGGRYSADPTDFLAEGLEAKEVGEKWVVGVKIVSGETETEIIVTTEKQESKVEKLEETEKAEVFKDVDADKVAEVVEKIEQTTKVEGVKLSVTETDEKPAGIVAVVEEATKQDATFAAAVKSAAEVSVKVEVEVKPTEYVAPGEQAQGNTGKVAFKLTPKATVTVVQNETKLEKTVPVSNDMIDQNQKIAVSIYTGFRPVVITHDDDKGARIETFEGGQIVYNEATGVATVLISHFSTLTGFGNAEDVPPAKVFVAKIGEVTYMSLQAAVNAADNGAVITLLGGFSVDEAITVSGKAVEIRTEDYNTAATPTVGLRVNYFDKGKITANTIIYFRKSVNGNTVEIDRMLIGDFEMAIAALTAINSNEQVRYVIGLHGDVTLTKDIELPTNIGWSSTACINVKANCTFDLNGHSLTQKAGTGWSNYALFDVDCSYAVPEALNKMTFTLKNSSEGGSVQVPLHVLRTGIGTIVNIDGVDMVYGVGCTAPDVAQDESSGGQAVVVIGSEGVVNLSDSRIVADKETILEGEYPWSLLPYAGEIKVASGYYEGLMYGNDTGFGGINITGGTFASDYILWFTAEGYHPANDGSDLRTVVPADEVVASITYNKGTADEYTEYFLDFSIATGYADETEAEEIKVENGASTGNVPEGWEVKTDPTTGETTLVKSVVAELLGSGTAEDPFVIMTREQLRYFGDKVTAAEKYNQVTDYVVLGADIDLGGEEWTPIGTSAFDHCFNGVFDGQGHEILNLKVSSTASNVGLFAFLSHESHEWSGERTTIRNLTIRNADVKGVSNVGVISGSAQQTVRFENVNVIGVVKVEGTGADVGGILGHTASRVKMTGCSVIATEGSGSYVKAKTSGSAACGGLLGFHAGEANVKTTISNCHVENITMSSYNRIGGIVGMVQMKSSYPAETEIFGNTVTNVSITVYGPGASTEKLNGRHSAQAGLIVGASTENGTRRYHFYHDNSYGGICSVTPTIATATDVIPTQLYGLWTLGTTRSKDAAARGLAYHADWANGNGDVVTEPEVTFGGDDYKTFLRAYFSQSETAVDAGATISSEDDPFVLHTDVGYTLIAQDRIYVKADGNIFYPRTDLGREIRSVDCGDGVTLYYVAPEGGVCKIGDRIFETLADAFREAKPTDTVVLTADAAMAVDAGVSPVCKIDMKGFTLSVPDDPAYDGKVVDSANATKLLGYVVEDGVRAYSHEANDDFKNSGDEKGWDGSWGVYNIYLNGYAAVIEAQSSDVPAENIKITYQKDGVTHVALYNKVNYPARVFSGWKYPKANFGVDSSEKSLTVTVKSGKIEGIRASSKVTSKPTAETLDPVLASSTVNIEGGEVGSIVSSWNFNQSIDVYNVNVSGGKVGVIYGNGQTDRQSAFNHQNVDKSVYVPVVKEANITVTGGEIGTIYGGGYGNMNPMTTDPQGPWTMETKAANITVKSGVVGAIYGGGQCGAYGDFDKIVVDQANIAISGGCVGSVVKDSGVGRLAEVKEAVATLSGGIYTAKPDATYIAEGYAAENNPDEATKDAYPWKVQEPTVKDPIVIDIDPSQEGGAQVPVTVTQELAAEILPGVDVTQPLTEAQVQTIVTQLETKGEDGMTGWQKYTAGFSQTDKHPLAPMGRSGENGQLVLVTSLIAPKPLSVDTGVKVKYILLKGSSVDEKTGLPTKWTKVQELPTPEFPVEVNLLDPETYWKIDAEYNATKQVQQ